MSIKDEWKKDKGGVIAWIAVLLFAALALTGPIIVALTQW